MKGVLVVAVLLALAVAGFVAFVRFGASNAAEPSPATQELSAFVDRAEPKIDRRLSNTSGHALSYTYDTAGRSYSAEAWVPDILWTPDRGLVRICVDPDDPALHVVPTRVGAECGDGSVGRNPEQRAEASGP